MQTSKAYLSGGFRYLYLPGVADVAAIITNLVAELVANGWTDESGAGTGPCKSPVDSEGIFLRVQLTRVSATRIKYYVFEWLGWRVNYYSSDQTLLTIQDIDAGGTNVALYSGPDYFLVDSERATRECFWACRAQMDPYVGGRDVRPQVLCSGGPRLYTGNLGNQGIDSVCLYYQQDGGGSYSNPNNCIVDFRPYSNNIKLQHPSGGWITRPVNFMYYTGGLGLNLGQWLGRMPQAVLVDGSLAFGSQITVAVEADENGTVTAEGAFKVVGLTTAGNQRMAVRIS